MGITYIPRNKAIDDHNESYSFADAIGEVHAAFYLPVLINVSHAPHCT